MNRKMKTLAIATACLLGSGMSGGVALAQSSSSPSVSITLSPGTTMCVATAQSGSLGTYTWGGSPGSYTRTTPGTFSVNLTVDQQLGTTGTTCDLSVYATSDFAYQSGGTYNFIHASSVGLKSETTLNSPTSLSIDANNPTALGANVAAGTYVWDANDLSSILTNPAPLPAGTYTTTFVLSSAPHSS